MTPACGDVARSVAGVIVGLVARGVRDVLASQPWVRAGMAGHAAHCRDEACRCQHAAAVRVLS